MPVVVRRRVVHSAEEGFLFNEKDIFIFI